MIDQGFLFRMPEQTQHGTVTVEFMNRAIEAEREACAKVCEDIYNDPKENDGYDCYYTRPYLECAAAIRARGQA